MQRSRAGVGVRAGIGIGVALGCGPALPVVAQSALDELVVTSSLIEQPRREVGTAVSVIDGAEIELRGYADLAAVLRTQTGVAVSNSGGLGQPTALRIRGEEHYRTMLVIDGVKAVDASAPQVAPSFESLLATSDLRRVEVLRGPQGFIYGADAGGVVNVLTQRGAGAFGGEVGLEYGAYATRKADAAFSGGNEHADYFVSLTQLRSAGFNAQTADTVLRDDDGAANTTLHAKIGWTLSDDVRLQLVARDIDAEADYDGCFSPVTFASVHDCRSTTEQTTYKLSADATHGDFTSALGLSHVDVARANFAADAPGFATDGGIDRFEYTGSVRPAEGLAFVFGLDLQDEELLDAGGTRSRSQRGYYAEYQGAFGSAWYLSLGARYDDNDDFGAHTSSRLTLAHVRSLVSGSALKYRASVGTGFRAPSLFEVAYNEGPFAFPPAAGVALEEETSSGADVGVEFDSSRGLHLEATYFDQRIEDEIVFDLLGFSGYLQAAGQSQSHGIELAAVAPLGERWRVSANWTRNEAEGSSGERRLRRPRDIGNVALSYRSATERLALVVQYRAARDALDIGGVALDDYAVVDVSARYELDARIELFGRVQNAGDSQYEEVLGYYAPGRAVYAGVRLRL